jgi:hypothetical protein
MPQGRPEPELHNDPLVCSECGRQPAATEDAETWRYRSDGIGELHPFCPDCDQREFGDA